MFFVCFSTGRKYDVGTQGWSQFNSVDLNSTLMLSRDKTFHLTTTHNANCSSNDNHKNEVNSVTVSDMRNFVLCIILTAVVFFFTWIAWFALVNNQYLCFLCWKFGLSHGNGWQGHFTHVYPRETGQGNNTSCCWICFFFVVVQKWQFAYIHIFWKKRPLFKKIFK